jgi:3D (Asp-Asp-Asp) domain-containing protein
MDTYSKNPVKTGIQLKLSLLASVLLAVLALGTSLAAWPEQNSITEENSLSGENLAIFNGNTLLPIVDPANPLPAVKSLSVVVTAYSSTVWQTDDTPFITAAGTHVRDGIVANNLLPFGTKIRMPELYGDRIFVVEDRMHSRKSQYHFDIWFSTYEEAKNFGVENTYVEILEN